jgi:iron complex outermembrane receptor protein
VGYGFKKTPVRVKIGATNLLNQYYTSFLAGPSIGGFYYCNVSFGIN